MDKRAFYDGIRPLFGGRLVQAQVDGIEAILSATSGLEITWRAYMLATAFHETSHTMQPITEYGGRRYFEKYDTGRLAARLGNTPEADGDGYIYRGRGYVQLTGHANYERAGRKLGLDLVSNPGQALQPDVASRIMVGGMTEGWFTGRRLADYLPGNYVDARRIINGIDCASKIASYAEEFEQAARIAS